MSDQFKARYVLGTGWPDQGPAQVYFPLTELEACPYCGFTGSPDYWFERSMDIVIKEREISNANTN